jgi:uncharacterized protein (TIGR02611 family)
MKVSEEQAAQGTRRDGSRLVSRVRDRVRATPGSRLVYRASVAVVGLAVAAGGLVLVPLPGPGWIIVFVGLAILASEFAWAQRLLDYVRDRVRAWTGWVMHRPIWVRVAISLVTVGFVAAATYLLIRLQGVPPWVLELVPAAWGLI